MTHRKGTAFERLIADHLAHTLDDDRIDRRVRHGAKDRGDLAGLRAGPLKIVAELKNQNRLSLAEWVDEAVLEMGNDDADIAVVVHKRRGRGNPADQYVTMRVTDFVALLTRQAPKEAM